MREGGGAKTIKVWTNLKQQARMEGERVLELGLKFAEREEQGIALEGSVLNRRDTKRCRGDSLEGGGYIKRGDTLGKGMDGMTLRQDLIRKEKQGTIETDLVCLVDKR